MRVVARLGVLFYMSMLLLIGCALIAFALHLVPVEETSLLMDQLYRDRNARWIIAAVAVLILVKNYVYARAILGDQQREKTIAFDNPAGRVSVSLVAMEDLTRQVILLAPEVKEARVDVLAGKKGVDVVARLVLNADVNIPEITARLQDSVRSKIQDIIGLEETIAVRIHVVKIVPQEAKTRRGKEPKAEPQDPTIPFQGYRA